MKSPVPLNNKDAEKLADWIENQTQGKKVVIDRSTALRIAETLRWVATENVGS